MRVILGRSSRLAAAAATLLAACLSAPLALAQSSSLATISVSGHTAIAVDAQGNPVNQSTGFNQDAHATGTGATPANVPLTHGTPTTRVLNYELGAFARPGTLAVSGNSGVTGDPAVRSPNGVSGRVSSMTTAINHDTVTIGGAPAGSTVMLNMNLRLFSQNTHFENPLVIGGSITAEDTVLMFLHGSGVPQSSDGDDIFARFDFGGTPGNLNAINEPPPSMIQVSIPVIVGQATDIFFNLSAISIESFLGTGQFADGNAQLPEADAQYAFDLQWGDETWITDPTTGRLIRNLSIGSDANFDYHLGDFTPPGVAVPEPAAWALMIAGLGLAGLGLRRRQAGVLSLAV